MSGLRIRARREAIGLTQKALASLAKVGESSISELELYNRGRRALKGRVEGALDALESAGAIPTGLSMKQKTCPYCGGEYIIDHRRYFEESRLMCQGCGAYGPEWK